MGDWTCDGTRSRVLEGLGVTRFLFSRGPPHVELNHAVRLGTSESTNSFGSRRINCKVSSAQVGFRMNAAQPRYKLGRSLTISFAQQAEPVTGSIIPKRCVSGAT